MNIDAVDLFTRGGNVSENERAFRELAARSGQPEWAVDEVLDMYRASGWPLTNSERSRFVQHVARIAERYGEKTPDRVLQHRSALGRLASLELVEAIDDDVREIRRKVFGREDAPFAPEDYGDAVAWLEAEQERTKRRLTPDESDRLDKIEKQMISLMQEGREIDGHDWSFVSRWPMVAYWKANGERGRLAVRRGMSLLPLVKGAARLADATGFTEPAIVAYILIGEPPELPRWRWRQRDGMRTLRNGRQVWRRSVTITLEEPDLSEEKIGALLREIRKEWDETPENAAIRRLIRSAGGVPDKAPFSFWLGIADRWAAVGLPMRNDDRAALARALRVRFGRLPDAHKRQLRRARDKS